MFLSVIIPTYNKSETIQEILNRVQATELAGEIVVVDDGSIDGTRDILEQLDGTGLIKVIYHEKNQGKGRAVVTGFRNSQGDVILIQDADLEYDPRLSCTSRTYRRRGCRYCIWLPVFRWPAPRGDVLAYGGK